MAQNPKPSGHGTCDPGPSDAVGAMTKTKTLVADFKPRPAPPPRAEGSPARGRRHGKPATNGSIYDRINLAIVEHRLPPGTKLGEDRIASIFHVSRARVREVFARLAHEGVVDVVPQRGAFVARPSPQQARDVLEMRRLIEPGAVRRLIATRTPEALARLREHHAREIDARRRNDTRSIIRLSGEFHVLLADLAGNSRIAQSVRQLSTQTCLVIALYDAPTTDACRADEHALLLDAIENGDSLRGEKLMLAHLAHIESSLRFSPVDEDVDLEAVLGEP